MRQGHESWSRWDSVVHVYGVLFGEQVAVVLPLRGVRAQLRLVQAPVVSAEEQFAAPAEHRANVRLRVALVTAIGDVERLFESCSHVGSFSCNRVEHRCPRPYKQINTKRAASAAWIRCERTAPACPGAPGRCCRSGALLW